MSDPVTNVEIEDVLASIRRLVSEDSRPETAPQEVPGKLVLTPALRISDAPDRAESGRSPASPPGVESAPAMEPAGRAMPDDDYTEDTEEPQPLESADLEARFADMIEEDDLAGLAEVAPEEPAEAEASAEGATMQDAYLQAEPEQAVSVEWEDAGIEEEPAPSHAPADAAFDEYEIETVGEDVGTEADTDLEELAGFDGEEEGILDEETLRELVTDIVRQELQGALGERITRNVRKLVRREIHRALTSHDLQ